MNIHDDIKKIEVLQLAVLIAESDPNVLDCIKWNDRIPLDQQRFLHMAENILQTHVLLERPKVCPYPAGCNCPHL